MTSSAEIHGHAPTVNTLDDIRFVLDALRIKKSKFYGDIKAGLYTPPVKIGPRTSRWPRSEVVALNAARIAGKTDTEIRALVNSLLASRLLGAGGGA